jgi:hypothetical protein
LETKNETAKKTEKQKNSYLFELDAKQQAADHVQLPEPSPAQSEP